MLATWTLLLIISKAICEEVTESAEDMSLETEQNITTLYPITNKAYNDSTEKATDNNKTTTLKSDATIWKIETAFAESKLAKNEQDVNNTEAKALTENSKNCSQEFRPSTHLGSFFDDDSLDWKHTRTKAGEFTPIKKPPAAFVSAPKDDFKSILSKIPKDIFRNPDKFPYKFENAILTRAKNNWKPASALESKPTEEVPVRVPAGGLYKLPDPFKEKPELGDDEDFGLEFNGQFHDSAVKKRVNPWKNLLRLVTAFIPVGLIISALTPSVITIQSSGPDHQLPTRVYRRSDDVTALSLLPPISERCRRRLLCELHSDTNYQLHNSSGRRRGKQCYRLPCEDPQALSKTLRWLLVQSRQATGDDRGVHFT